MNVQNFFQDAFSRLIKLDYQIFLVMLAGICILILGNKLGKLKKYILTMPFVILIFVFFNPFINWLMLRVGYDTDYYRIYWLMPLTGIFAFTLMCMWKKCDIFIDKIIVVMLVVAIVYIQEDYMRLDSMKLATNSLHINNETIEVADVIMQDDRVNKLAVVPDSLSWEIRSYDASIKLLNGWHALNHYYEDEFIEEQKMIYHHLNNNEEPDVKYVGEWCRMLDFVYVVWDKGKVDSKEMEKYLYEKIGETENYDIYAVNRLFIND